MRINTMNLGIVIGIALAACQGADGVQPAADEATGDAGGKAGAGGASGNAGTAGSGDTGGSSGEAGSAGSGAEKCIPGLVNDCHCADGSDGVQTCKGDGTFEACKCEGGTGGTSGSGGSAGSSGGSGGLPGCIPGESKDCRCLDLSDGTQQCASDGKSYGLCVCPDGTGGTSGSGGSAGEPGDGTVDVDFAFTPPPVVPMPTSIVLWGIPSVGSAWGDWLPLCHIGTPTGLTATQLALVLASEQFVKSGSRYACTSAQQSGIKLHVNAVVMGPDGTLYPSTEDKQWACYGVGTACNSSSCWDAYGTLEVDGSKLTVPGDAENNGLNGCNYAFDIE